MTDIQTIKDKIDIAEIIRAKVQLHPAGKNLKGLCPFHKEKTPSFIVSPDRQMWHCFGCSKGGDVIKFLMEYENIEFFEALKLLAEKAGVELTRGAGDQRQFNILYDINRAAKDYFHAELSQTAGPFDSAQGKPVRQAQGKPAKAALDYLLGRGLKKETVEEFEIGFAPNTQDGLTRAMTKAGYAITDVERAGLTFKTERGTYWDRFRSRIMFPLYNQFGKVIAFTGRVMPGEEGGNTGKYVNSPETPIFSKSKLLFGLHKSKEAIRETKTAVLVEGQMDFLMVWQDGIKNAVATSGTALTFDHLKNLKRFAEKLVLVFDEDEAGQMASERTIDLAEANDFDVSVVDYSRFSEGGFKAKDPADIVKERPGFMKEILVRTKPAMEYYFSRYLTAGLSDLHEKKKNVRVLLAKIKNIFSPVSRAHWVKQLSTQTGISEPTLIEEMEKLGTEEVKEKNIENQSSQVETQPQTRKESILYRLLSLAYTHEKLRELIRPAISDFPEPFRAIALHLADQKAITPELQPTLDLIQLRSGLEVSSDDPEKIRDECAELLRQLKKELLKEKRFLIQEKIRKAETTKDETALAASLKEFDSVSKEMHNV